MSNTTLTPDQYASNMIIQLATSITGTTAASKLAVYQSRLADIPYYIDTLNSFKTKLEASIHDIQVINNNTVVDPAADLVYTAGSPVHTDYVNPNTNSNTAAVNPTGGVVTAGTNTAGTNTAGTNTAGTNTAGTNTAGTNTAGTNTAGTNTAGTNTTGTNNTTTPTGPITQGGSAPTGTTTTPATPRTVTTPETCSATITRWNCESIKANPAYNALFVIGNGNRISIKSISHC